MKYFKLIFNNNKRISDREARHLTEMFLAGETTIDQEKTLYRYYAGAKVAGDLDCYREMFVWYEGLGHLAQSEDDTRRRRSRRLALVASISALFLIGVGIIAGLSTNSDYSSPEAVYAGSYIIRNGKKISDIEKILPELRRADRYIDSTLSAFSKPVYVDPEMLIITEALKNIDDPEIKSILLADMN